jgi:hypothetical protein
MAIAGIAHWYSYSSDQYRAANFFSQRSAELEAHPGDPVIIDDVVIQEWGDVEQIEHRSCVTAAILSSITFLEASLNELFASAADDDHDFGEGEVALTEKDRKVLCDVSETVETVRFLDKFQLVLHLLGREPFDRGTQPYQDIALLVRLRNLLVHSKPGWTPFYAAWDEISDDKLMRSLAEKKFPVHSFTNEGRPFFPDRCLGAACANWAWQTAKDFADEFYKRLGLTPPYAPSRGGRRKRTDPELD